MRSVIQNVRAALAPGALPVPPRIVVFVLLVMAVSVFLFARWGVVARLFDGRTLPYENDDALYLAQVEQFRYLGFAPLEVTAYTSRQQYLSWSAAMALGHTLLPGLSPLDLFVLQHYAGLAILAGVLAVIGWRCGGWLLAVIVLLVLSLFYGDGAYHGFYRVVPSFYVLLSFLLMLALIIPAEAAAAPAADGLSRWRVFWRSVRHSLDPRKFSRRELLGIGGLAVLTAYVHPGALMAPAFLVVTGGLVALLEGRVLRPFHSRIVLYSGVMGLALLIWMGLALLGLVPDNQAELFSHVEAASTHANAALTDLGGQPAAATAAGDAAPGPAAPEAQAAPQSPAQPAPPDPPDPLAARLDRYNALYFGWFTASARRFFTTVPFLLIGLAAAWLTNRQHYLVPLFVGVLVPAFIAAFFLNYGRRFFLIVWPVTFLLVAYGYYAVLQIGWAWLRGADQKRLRWAGAAILLVAVGGLALLVPYDVLLQFQRADRDNTAYNFTWDQACVDEVLSGTAPGDLVAYPPDSQNQLIWLMQGLMVRPIANYNALSPADLDITGQDAVYVACDDGGENQSCALLENPAFVLETVQTCGDFRLLHASPVPES